MTDCAPDRVDSAPRTSDPTNTDVSRETSTVPRPPGLPIHRDDGPTTNRGTDGSTHPRADEVTLIPLFPPPV